MKRFGILFALYIVVCISQINTSNLDTSTENSTNLIDLPFELLLITFERLDFKSLINIGLTNHQYRDVVDSIFEKKLKISTIIISDTKLEVHNSEYELTIDTDFNSILDFLRYFGHFITKVKLLYYQMTNKARYEVLNEHIIKYAAEFITNIDSWLMISSSNCSVLNSNVIFPKAEIVRFNGLTYRDGVDTYDYNRIPIMFPAMRSLNIHNINLTESLNHIPNMEQLKIHGVVIWTSHLFPYIFNSTMKVLEQTLKNNPQIRHLEINNFCTWYTIEMISKVLPMLETLVVFDVNYFTNWHGIDLYTGEPIQFKNMKIFKYMNSRIIDHRIPSEFVQQNPLVFGNLEEIQFDDDEIGVENWIRIALENRNLKSINTLVVLNGEQLKQIAEGLPNLEQFKMRFQTFNILPIDDVVQFMQKAKYLNKASFVRVSEGYCKAIAKHLANEWKVETIEGYFCTFVRFTR